ncbi:histidine-rich metal-binding polypeptide-like [Coccinella septempunctata]|uniref:histidine-rich metal-binding polypeptide-like n=1 Tax=Coccinella septempunctata TaxID=41139 RepID=UPI001D0823F7|nr:histidine-rich metal-binding polypeptide-like [Coccinella septempunctata]
MASVNKIETRIIDIDDDCDCSERGRDHKHRHHHPGHHDHNKHHHDHHNHHGRHHHEDDDNKTACIKSITVYSVEERRMKTRKVKEVKYDNPWCFRKF